MAEIRLIDANVLLRKISRMLDYCQDNKLEDEMSALFQVGDAVMDCHTIDPESLRPKGRWKNGVCTACKFDLRCLTDGENDLEQWVWDEGFDYCPNCGAKMEG